MKKAAILVLILLALSVVLVSFLLAGGSDDYQVIKKAVKENPNYKPGKEAKWFKVLVADSKTNKVAVKVTLPISVIEIFLECAGDKHLKIDHDDCEIDLKEVFKELKKLGPMALIEVYQEDETVKIWLE
jgi:cell division septation protein DedD